MNLSANSALLATGELFQGLNSRFSKSQPSLDIGDLGIAVAVLLGLVAAIYAVGKLATRLDASRRYNSPRRLFRDLCQAHGLDRRQRRLLSRLAYWQHLRHPARLFLEPQRYEVANLGPHLDEFADQYEALRDKLFATDETSSSA